MADSLNTNLLDKLCLFLLQSFLKIKIDQLEREYILNFQGIHFDFSNGSPFLLSSNLPLAAVSSSVWRGRGGREWEGEGEPEGGD